MITSEFEDPSGRTTVATASPRGLTVLAGDDTLSFAPSGRLTYASLDGAPIKRGYDNSVRRGPDVLPPLRARPLLAAALDAASRIREAAPAGIRPAFDGIWPLARLDEDAARFTRLYGSVPVLPPDQYGAAYLQPAPGCPAPGCSFCTLYEDRPFRILDPAEFERHLEDVLAFLGPDAARRSSVFFGDANAAAIPRAALEPMLRAATAAFPGRRVHAFTDARLARRARVEDLAALREAGLERLTLGLETGHPPLYAFLAKPGTLEEARRTVAIVKEAGLSIGLSILVGIGGLGYEGSHVSDTLGFLGTLPLGPGDYVYLSPLRPDPGSEYARVAASPALAVPGPEGLAAQARNFRDGLARDGRGFKTALYDVSRFVYG